MTRGRILAAAFFLACASAQADQGRQPGEYLVTLAPDAGEKPIRDVYGRFGIRAIKALSKDVYLVTLADDPGPAAMESFRERSDLITAVQPNYRYRRR